MTLSDSGVWVGLRNEPILFLYHTSSHTHLQTVNLEPLISSRLGDLQSPHLSNRHNQRICSPVGVTALLASEDNLWIGTNLGLVITIPLRKPGDTDRATNQSSTGLAIVESTADVSNSRAECGISSLLLSQMKVSRHEHGRSVRFFVKVNRAGSRHSDTYHRSILDSSFVGRDVPQTSTPLKRSNSYLSHYYSHSLCTPERLIISGGQGYRFNEDSVEKKSTPTERESHLIVWNCTQASPP
ncbi:hypothetical protein EG68_11289 [Paragonimus skrjabini miyazakii]|uniref:Uncharacterized protein n=1 Tax=Paragonimus skrjabini miyazakii TaxID=59628 RepID=A0A8S9YEJ0_9TREM|nr:hypothetical protein EG68_11289 [Paragonimus skrjabini miyazakii]